MLIDWFTVVAQVFNFIVLVWLLKRYLYGPVLSAIGEREKRIARQIQEAETKMAGAEKELTTYQKKNAEIDEQRQQLIEQAKEEAHARRQELMDAARQEAEELRARLENALRTGQHRLNGEIMDRAAREVFSIARKTLTDLASLEVEDQMVNVLIRKIRQQKAPERESMRKAFGTPDGRLRVLSSLELSDQQREKIREALAEFITPDQGIDFTTDPHLIGGIEIRSREYKLSWTIGDYLSAMERNVVETLRHSTELSS